MNKYNVTKTTTTTIDYDGTELTLYAIEQHYDRIDDGEYTGIKTAVYVQGDELGDDLIYCYTLDGVYDTEALINVMEEFEDVAIQAYTEEINALDAIVDLVEDVTGLNIDEVLDRIDDIDAEDPCEPEEEMRGGDLRCDGCECGKCDCGKDDKDDTIRFEMKIDLGDVSDESLKQSIKSFQDLFNLLAKESGEE